MYTYTYMYMYTFNIHIYAYIHTYIYKIWTTHYNYTLATEWVTELLRELDLDYVDLVLMHAARRMDCIDQRAFVVGLEKGHLDTKRLGPVAAHLFDLGQGGAAVNLGLPLPQQVQVRPIQDQN